MSKEMFCDAHEQLVAKYMEANPDIGWHEAYEATADAAYDRMHDRLADMGDAMRQRAKDVL